MNQPPMLIRWRWWLGAWVALVIGAAATNPRSDQLLYARGAPQALGESIRFAVIGDFGVNNQAEGHVANLVKSWAPELIVTVGDNNYVDGAAATIDVNIGQYYQEYIFPYVGAYGPGATENRFFPALGNHDWQSLRCVDDACSGPYFDYFTLPGNERYYDFVRGPVHFFIIDSDSSEPDGQTATSIQAAWLQAQLAASTARWKLVFLHHAPYSSSVTHGSDEALQWPYAAWGAHAVFAGHDHLYERILHEGILYFVNGAGGANLYSCGTRVPGSQLCYSRDQGAMLVVANDEQITFQFITRSPKVVDTYTLYSGAQPTPTATSQPTSTPIPAPGYDIWVGAASDDGEELVNTGDILLVSSDLELVTDDTRGDQIVGLRFPNVPVSQGITITHAYLEFTVDEVNAEATSLQIRGAAVDHALPFTTTLFDISLRPQTAISVTWENLPGWEVIGAKERTPNLASIVQEIVGRPGWVSGNALALVISGSGHRTASAYDGGVENAPRLRVEYPGAPTPLPTAPGAGTPNGAWLPYVGR